MTQPGRLTSRSFAAVDDVSWQRRPIAGEDEPEEAGNADRVSPTSVRDREEANACDEEGNREPCVQPDAHKPSAPGSDRALGRARPAVPELAAERQPEEERKRREEQQRADEDRDDDRDQRVVPGRLWGAFIPIRRLSRRN